MRGHLAPAKPVGRQASGRFLHALRVAPLRQLVLPILACSLKVARLDMSKSLDLLRDTGNAQRQLVTFPGRFGRVGDPPYAQTVRT